MKSLLATILVPALLTGGCTKGPADKADCTADVTVIHIDEDAPCNLTPPQTLVILLPHGGDADMILCDDLGGQVLLHKGDALCINIDY